jgi:hypothetical protein
MDDSVAVDHDARASQAKVRPRVTPMPNPVDSPGPSAVGFARRRLASIESGPASGAWDASTPANAASSASTRHGTDPTSTKAIAVNPLRRRRGATVDRGAIVD